MPLWLLLPLVCATAWAVAKWRRCRRRNRVLERRLAVLESAGGSGRPTGDDDATVRLRAQLKLLDRVINTIPHPIYFMTDGRVLHGCNLAFARQLVGVPPERVIGRSLDSLADGLPSPLVALMGGPVMRSDDAGREATVVCADGRERDFLVETATVRDEGGTVLGKIGVLLDLTARNRAAREQMAREKLQGALETAGAVCHELNQPLQAITGYAELLAEGIDSDHPDYPWIDRLAEDIRRIAGITRKLQNITRYETRPYARGVAIVDLDRASERDGAGGPPADPGLRK